MSAILPLPDPPRIVGGFETIIEGPLLDRQGNEMPVEEWSAGVIGTNLPPQEEWFTNSLAGGDWGDPDDGDEKPSSTAGNGKEFQPSSVGVQFKCQMNENTPQGNIPLQQVASAMKRKLWSMIANHIANIGTTLACPGKPGTNPTLQGVAKLPDGYVDAAPGNPRGVVQGLLDMVCAGTGADPVFLVPYSYKAQMMAHGLVHWDKDAQRYVLLETYRIAFDCIENVGPDGTTTKTDGSEFWIYAMPPTVRVSVADADQDDIKTWRTQRINVHGVRAERQFEYDFDTDNVYAGKATVL